MRPRNEHGEEARIELRFGEDADSLFFPDPVADLQETPSTGLPFRIQRDGTGRAQGKGLLEVLISVMKDEELLPVVRRELTLDTFFQRTQFRSQPFRILAVAVC